ncbi:hypothetical protein EON63_09665 [archaeon]|nr:MAG: hypothetical protein EON63_09665 [archaeon]
MTSNSCLYLLFRSTGQIAPLPELLALKEEFYYRMVLDESFSFGVLGKTGRGLLEHFGRDRGDVEVITFALDTTLAGTGGMCIGTSEVS